MPRKKGKWFEGNIFSMSVKEMEATKHYGLNVIKPTALETKIRKGKPHSRYYHKPVQPGEFWD